MLIIGVISICYYFILKPQEYDEYNWPYTNSRILSIKQREYFKPQSKALFLPKLYQVFIKYEFEVNGEKYFSWFFIDEDNDPYSYDHQKYNINSSFRIYYDPKNPNNNTPTPSTKGNTAKAMFIAIISIISSSFILIPNMAKYIKSNKKRNKDNQHKKY